MDRTVWKILNMKREQRINAVIFLVLLAWSLIILFPLLWAISTSMKPPNELFSHRVYWVPEEPTIRNYYDVLNNRQMMRYLINTVFISAASSVGVIIVSSLTGFALSRYKVKGRKIAIMSLVSVQMFPPIMFIVPYFILMRSFGLYNTYFALIATRMVFFIPFSSLMVKSFCDSIPTELDEAAIVDGSTQLGTFFRIISPLLVPSFATVAIFTFLNSWNEYLFSITVVSRDNLRTITAGLSSLVGEYDINWGQLMSLSVISIILPLFIVLAMQNFFIKGLTAGAVKG